MDNKSQLGVVLLCWEFVLHCKAGRLIIELPFTLFTLSITYKMPYIFTYVMWLTCCWAYTMVCTTFATFIIWHFTWISFEWFYYMNGCTAYDWIYFTTCTCVTISCIGPARSSLHFCPIQPHICLAIILSSFSMWMMKFMSVYTIYLSYSVAQGETSQLRQKDISILLPMTAFLK